MQDDLTAHEIIVLSRTYHLSIHFPEGSMYAHVWLGINQHTHDQLISLSELRKTPLDTTPTSEQPAVRKDSGCTLQQLPTRTTHHGLCNCPKDVDPCYWLVTKETLAMAESVCETHAMKIRMAVKRIEKLRQPNVPGLSGLLELVEILLARNARRPGPIDDPTCCICAASPFTRLFFSML
ncbi:hypothetical protein EC988_002694 [Linderina pennispora]|nr:hypothetical protein EC988_002694 [Linderina pennispora]